LNAPSSQIHFVATAALRCPACLLTLSGLDAELRARGVVRVDVVGLALEACVLHTALDARCGSAAGVMLGESLRVVWVLHLAYLRVIHGGQRVSRAGSSNAGLPSFRSCGQLRAEVSHCAGKWQPCMCLTPCLFPQAPRV